MALSLRSQMEQDFRVFLWRVWKEIGLGTPSPLQYDFAQYLQENLETPEGRAIILMAFRGAAKSYVTTTFAVWLLFRDRSEVVLVTSATGGFAGNIATFAFQMVTNFDFLADMKPTSDQRRSALAFDVAGCPPAVKDESFSAQGIFGQITGRRASRIIGDDLETPNTSDTEGTRQKLRERVAELGGAILKPGGSIYLLGTAQTEDTIYKEYADEKGYELRIYPVLFPKTDVDPKKDELKKYGSRLAPFIANQLTANPLLAGTSTEPGRFTEADILKRMREWGKTEFDRQFRMWMDAGGGRGNPLKLRDLVVLDGINAPGPTIKDLLLPAEMTYSPLPTQKLDIQVDALNGDSAVYAPTKVDVWLPAEEIVCYVDPSGEGTDETTWTIGAGLLGAVFVLFQGYSTEGHTAETLESIAKDCKRWRVRKIEVESNFGQGMFGELLTPKLNDINWPCEIEDIRQGAVQKEKRIVETLEPLVTDHRLILSADLLRRDFTVEYEHVEANKRRYHRLTYQLTRMTKQKGCVKHDDRADGLSGLARHFVGVLLRQRQAENQEGRLRSIELEGERIIELRKAQGLPLYGADKKGTHLGRPSKRKR